MRNLVTCTKAIFARSKISVTRAKKWKHRKAENRVQEP